MSKRGNIIRGAGGLLKRNTDLGVGVGTPHGGDEGDIRVQMVNSQPRLYAKAGGEWYNAILYKNPIAAVFEEDVGTGTSISLDADSSFTLANNRINMNGGVGRYQGQWNRDKSIAIGTEDTMASLSPSQLSIHNIAIGDNALRLGTEMQYNVAIGTSAMEYIGQHVDDIHTDCYANVAIGLLALQGNSSGRPQARENVAIGRGAMSLSDTIDNAANMTCMWNVAVGIQAGYYLEGQYNTCVGANAGYTTLTEGNNNTLLGASTNTSAVDSENQIAIGYGAVCVKDDAAVIGDGDLEDVYMSDEGTATVHCGKVGVGLGTSAPLGLITVAASSTQTDPVDQTTAARIEIKNTSDTLSGAALDFIADDGSRTAGIYSLRTDTTGNPADLIFANNPGGAFLERMRIKSDGLVGIGITPATLLHIAGDDAHFRITDTTGTTESWNFSVGQGNSGRLEVTDSDDDNGVRMEQNDVSWTSSSDERLKTNWTAFDDAVGSINSLTKIGTFQFTKSIDDQTLRNDTIHAGLSAQEVQKFLPCSVSGGDDGILGLKYTELIPVLCKAIQELSAKVDTIEERLNKE